MNGEQLREYRRECLLDEHRSLSSFVEKEIVVTTLAKMVAVVSWLAGIGSRPTAASLVAVLVLWWVDVNYAYIGDVYKRRRLQVRAWLEALPKATDQEMAAWKTPANPFDALNRSAKISVLVGTIASPNVSTVYAVLALASVVLALS